MIHLHFDENEKRDWIPMEMMKMLYFAAIKRWTTLLRSFSIVSESIKKKNFHLIFQELIYNMTEVSGLSAFRNKENKKERPFVVTLRFCSHGNFEREVDQEIEQDKHSFKVSEDVVFPLSKLHESKHLANMSENEISTFSSRDQRLLQMCDVRKVEKFYFFSSSSSFYVFPDSSKG